MLTVRQTEQLGKVINLDNRDTSRRFNESEKQELIEYLHVACDEDNHKQFLKDNPLGEFTDYVDASQDNESMYSQFVVRFVDLLILTTLATEEIECWSASNGNSVLYPNVK